MRLEPELKKKFKRVLKIFKKLTGEFIVSVWILNNIKRDNVILVRLKLRLLLDFANRLKWFECRKKWDLLQLYACQILDWNNLSLTFYRSFEF